jgi:methionine--tRNA ligase beta chain
MKKPIVSFLDFQKLDLRIGEVKEASFVEGSRNLIAIKVNLGDDYGIVEILAGIGEYYKAEELVGKKYIFVVNLEPKKMMGRYSNGMILVADDESKPILVEIDKRIKNGLVVR